MQDVDVIVEEEKILYRLGGEVREGTFICSFVDGVFV